MAEASSSITPNPSLSAVRTPPVKQIHLCDAGLVSRVDDLEDEGDIDAVGEDDEEHAWCVLQARCENSTIAI